LTANIPEIDDLGEVKAMLAERREQVLAGSCGARFAALPRMHPGPFAAGWQRSRKMKTDKQIYLLLGTGADAFRFLTGGIELPGPYRGRSVVFKELERRADHVFEPESGEGPAYLIEIQAQRGGDVYDRLVLELVLYRKAHPGRTVYGLVIFLDAGCDEPDSPWVGSLGTGPLLRPVYLDAVLAQAREREPEHPLLAVFLPLRADERELAERAPAAWRRLEGLTEPGSKKLSKN
jgi:hypothetical protein